MSEYIFTQLHQARERELIDEAAEARLAREVSRVSLWARLFSSRPPEAKLTLTNGQPRLAR